MKDDKRGVRRSHTERMKQRAYRKYKDWTWYAETWTDREIKQLACRKANNMKDCSCWMCGNPRKFFQGKAELTIQEQKQERNLQEGIDEYFRENNPRGTRT